MASISSSIYPYFALKHKAFVVKGLCLITLLSSGCTVGLNTIDKPIDTADVGLDTADVDTGITVNTNDTQDTGTQDTGTEDTNTQDTQPTSDVDGDGYRLEDGDCNDYNPDVHPGMEDRCDTIDNDCDGAIDEDSIGAIYEPNDTEWNGYFLGEYYSAEYVEVQGLISHPTDVDIYDFFIDDRFSWFSEDFSIEFELESLSIQADFVVELWLIYNDDGDYEEQLMIVDNLLSGGMERGHFDGSLGTFDEGEYEFRIYALNGADCDAHYNLKIQMNP